MNSNGKARLDDQKASEMRRLAVCPGCSLQFDISKIPPGNRFRCSCGGTVEVAPAGKHETVVVRCSSCGAPRDGRASECGFCGSSYSLREQDLNTLCPRCASRIPDSSRFCHSCGVAILPQAEGGQPSEQACPACEEGHKLVSRPLDGDATVLECGCCGGLWLGHEVFGLLQERALLREIQCLRNSHPSAPPTVQKGPLYRRCAVCGQRMNRRNFQNASGVVMDVCAGHGVWFDLGELERILQWIQNGGLRRAEEQRKLKEREKARLAAFDELAARWQHPDPEDFSRSQGASTLVGHLMRHLIGVD